jgi:hypothetical protein
MKTYKLNGLEYYLCAFDVKDAILVLWDNGIAVTKNNIIETDINPNRDAIGKVFKSLEEYESFEIEY